MGVLVGIQGSFKGQSIGLPAGKEVIIGKDNVYDIVIDMAYKEVSRKHTGIIYDAVRNEYRIVDYSMNGTYVNGNRLERGREYRIYEGSRISLGNGENILELRNSQQQYVQQQKDIELQQKTVHQQSVQQPNMPYKQEINDNQIYVQIETNGLASASLVLGILSLICPTLLFGLLAVIFGAIGAKHKINHESAVAGLVCGIISLILDFCVIVFLIVLISTEGF